MSHQRLYGTKSITNNKSHKPTHPKKQQRKPTNPPPASRSPKKRAAPPKKTQTAERRTLAATDSFANAVLDPAHAMCRYPGNNTDSALSRLPFTVESAGAGLTAFSEDGYNNAYMTGHALEPAYVSSRHTRAWGGGTAPAVRGEQPLESDSTLPKPFLAPLFFGDAKTALFSDIVSFADGTTLAGYRCTIDTNSWTLTVAYPSGTVGSLSVWSRNAAGNRVNSAVMISSVGSSSQIIIPVNSTAFGFFFLSSLPFSGNLILVHSGGGEHGITIGNHASHCDAVSPDYSNMGIKRARTIGLSAWLRFDGSALHDGGRTAAVQFSPGVYPTEFPGKTTSDQVISSGLRGRYVGHFREGVHAKYVQKSLASYSLLPGTRSPSGLLVITWSSDPDAPQPWTLMFNQVIEFTTSVEAFERTLPSFATPNELAVALADLNRMQVITSNDAHDYVLRLWHHLKKRALDVATSPKTWYTIAEVGAGIAAAAL